MELYLIKRAPAEAALFLFIVLFSFFGAKAAEAHPMDLGGLQLKIVEGRVLVNLRLHALALARFAKLAHPPESEQELEKFAETIFQSTLGKAQIIISGSTCAWRRPALHFSANDRNFTELEIVAVCLPPKISDFSLNFPLPFLKDASPVFQLVVRVERAENEAETVIATPTKPEIKIGETDLKNFGGFLRMGMGHIGALPGEWRDDNGAFKFPEGLDHIFFVLALVLGGGTLLGLIKCVSGFTLGHSLTLALCTFKIIHIHSRWVEACIALSIAYVAGAAILRPRAPHRWVVAALFGTVHGLGFASALQELDLMPHELWRALLGFNLGVEMGQAVFVLLTFPLLMLIQRYSDKAYIVVHRAAAAALFLIGSYWFIVRAIN
ncbi:MAG: HupE/UreJ family protein [Bdellovibrionota bacterium]